MDYYIITLIENVQGLIFLKTGRSTPMFNNIRQDNAILFINDDDFQ